MADIWTRAKRSLVMARILSQDTGPERAVRKMVYGMGYRYRLNVRSLPGRPDIVLRKYNAVIFVHGCFWHNHRGCIDGKLPKTRKGYWIPKLRNTRNRDLRNLRRLRRSGWKVLRLWDCDIQRRPQIVAGRILRFLDSEKGLQQKNTR